jgi:hypothetical protein
VKTGHPFSVRDLSVIEVSDRRIWRNLGYCDAAAITPLVGVMPELKKWLPKLKGLLRHAGQPQA